MKGIKPQDVAILLKILANGESNWRQVDLADDLHLSQSEVSEGLERCRFSGLIDQSKKKIYRNNLLEFILYGLKYVFPAQLGYSAQGVPTAHSSEPMSSWIVSEPGDGFVWPSDDGNSWGRVIFPCIPAPPRPPSKTHPSTKCSPWSIPSG